ncbi:MAG: metallophosphoesterase [Gammaproteobacteria bacterium]|nr:metallophosphoesterase [Gammaproteobacteria bacterium]
MLQNLLLNQAQKKLELFGDSFEPNRPSRLCVSLSDLHFTDGTVGSQNLRKDDWDTFYAEILARCLRNNIKEVTLVLDGDVVDMIRSSRWAENKVYPWHREKTEIFSKILNEIIHAIVEEQHEYFFHWLQQLPSKLERDAKIKAAAVKIIVLLGNHDKELLCDQKALTYFYEKGLGRTLDSIGDEERASIGRMYGDETMFADKKTAPYLPFYYGDRGFRFFTTHGQWRDEDNCREVDAKAGLPRWIVADGWQNETWKKLKFSPFFLPCFGDTIAAGLLSTFIYKVKHRLESYGYQDKRLFMILGELDLYRPSYKALTRIIDETKSMRADKRDHTAILIIEDTLYECIEDWLNWDFTCESSPSSWCIKIVIMKYILKVMKFFGFKIKVIAFLVKLFIDKKNPDSGVSLELMAGFPAFMAEYREYGFQIHGEGHTHKALEEEPKFSTDKPTTYINFGTWRDQIIGRKNSGYRRRSVLRAFYIFDLKNKQECLTEEDRTLKYYTDDMIKWSDKSDAFSE